LYRGTVAAATRQGGLAPLIGRPENSSKRPSLEARKRAERVDANGCVLLAAARLVVRDLAQKTQASRVAVAVGCNDAPSSSFVGDPLLYRVCPGRHVRELRGIQYLGLAFVLSPRLT
jgi:hypothetical protein